MAASESPGDSEVPKVETYSYSAGSYDRLKSNEEELFELVRLSEVPIDKELFKVILELLKLNVAPAAILQVLKSLRSQNTPDDLESRSPVLKRNDPKHRQQQPGQPLTSEAPVISRASLNGGREVANHGAEKRVGQPERVEKRAGQPDRVEHGKKKSSHQLKNRGKGHSSRNHEGSVKHKIKEPP